MITRSPLQSIRRKLKAFEDHERSSRSHQWTSSSFSSDTKVVKIGKRSQDVYINLVIEYSQSYSKIIGVTHSRVRVIQVSSIVHRNNNVTYRIWVRFELGLGKQRYIQD